VSCCGNVHPRRRDGGSRVEEWYDDSLAPPAIEPPIERDVVFEHGVGPPRIVGKPPIVDDVYLMPSDSDDDDGDPRVKHHYHYEGKKKSPPNTKSEPHTVHGKPGCDSDDGLQESKTKQESNGERLNLDTKGSHVRSISRGSISRGSISRGSGRHSSLFPNVSAGLEKKTGDNQTVCTAVTGATGFTEGEDLDIVLDLLQQIRIRSRVTCLASPLKGAPHLCYAGTSDGRLLLVSDGKVAAPELHKRASTAISAIDTDRVAVGFFDGYVIVYDTHTEDRYELRPTRQKISKIACDPSGRIAVVHGSEVSILCNKKRAQLACIQLKKYFKDGEDDEVTALSFATKKLLVLGTKKGLLVAFSVDRQRIGGFNKKFKPTVKYTKKIGRTIRDVVTRVDVQKKSPNSFTFRVLFDTVSQDGDANTTVIDISVSQFHSKNQEETVGVVGVSEMEMRNACMMGGDLLAATKEGLLVWSGDDASGTEKLFVCGDREVNAFAWCKGKLYTTADSSILVWDLPENLLVGMQENRLTHSGEMNLLEFTKRSPISTPLGLPGTSVKGF